jgi:hypothetical protein
MKIVDKNNIEIRVGNKVKFKDYVGYRFHQKIAAAGIVNSIDPYATIYITLNGETYRDTDRDGFTHEVKKHAFFTEYDWNKDCRITCFNRSDMDSKICELEII